MVLKELETIKQFGLEKMSFEQQYAVETSIANISKSLASIDLEVLENLRNSFDTIVDLVGEMENTMTDLKIQNAFLIGEISATIKIVNEVFKTVSERISFDTDMSNRVLRGVIKAVGECHAISHGDLASTLSLNPAALTMRLKRDETWRKYVSIYTNPTKHNSVIYVLNGNGKEMYSKMAKQFIYSTDLNFEKKMTWREIQKDFLEEDFDNAEERITNQISRYRNIR